MSKEQNDENNEDAVRTQTIELDIVLRPIIGGIREGRIQLVLDPDESAIQLEKGLWDRGVLTGAVCFEGRGKPINKTTAMQLERGLWDWRGLVPPQDMEWARFDSTDCDMLVFCWQEPVNGTMFSFCGKLEGNRQILGRYNHMGSGDVHGSLECIIPPEVTGDLQHPDPKMAGPTAGCVGEGTAQNLSQMFKLPFQITKKVLGRPIRRALGRPPKMPTWSVIFETAVVTLRTAANNVPRDLGIERAITDQAIPALLLPKGVLRTTERWEKLNLNVEWAWPSRSTSSELKKRIKGTMFAPLPDKILLSTTIMQVSDDQSFLQALQAGPVVLYLHGGAFCLCGPGTHRQLTATLALECNAMVCVPDYRRPPDVPVQASLEDCVQVYAQLIGDPSNGGLGIPPERIVLAGDSAGGSLAIATLCELRDRIVAGRSFDGPVPGSVRLPAASVMISPWVDLWDRPRAAGKSMSYSMIGNSYFDFLPLDLVDDFAEYTAGDRDPRDASISPAYADLTDLPPMLVISGQAEILRDQQVNFGFRAELADPRHELKLYEDMPHVFPIFCAFDDTAKQAIRDFAGHLSRHCPV